VADHTERRLRRLIQTLDARLLELLTSLEDLPDAALQQAAALEATRNAAVRLLDAGSGPRRPDEPRAIIA
jgi:hypothetical protein